MNSSRGTSPAPAGKSAQSTFSNRPAPVPVQNPFDFAQRNVELADQLNSKLASLRTRLFGDAESEPDPNCVAIDSATKSLESLMQAANYKLSGANGQVEAIHNRL
jgi:hypothetical protein